MRAIEIAYGVPSELLMKRNATRNSAKSSSRSRPSSVPDIRGHGVEQAAHLLGIGQHERTILCRCHHENGCEPQTPLYGKSFECDPVHIRALPDGLNL